MSSSDNLHTSNIKLPQGSYLYEEGDDENAFYQLWKGELEVVLDTKTLFEIDETDYPIGIAEALLDVPKRTSVAASQDTVVKEYRADEDTLLEWLSEHPLVLITVIENNSRVLDRLNTFNRNLFERFRDLRPRFEPVIRPMSRIFAEIVTPGNRERHELYGEINDLKRDNPMGDIINSYREIVHHIGKSVQQSVQELSLPDNLKETFAKGQAICEEGEPGDELYILMQGSLAVLKEEQRVATIAQSGSVFGEMAAILRGERTASIQADGESVVAVLPFDNLPDLFQSSPELGRKLTMTFVKRCQKAFELFQQLRSFVVGVRNIHTGNELKPEFRDYLSDIVELIETNRDLAPEVLTENADELKPWAEGEKTLEGVEHSGMDDPKASGFKPGEKIV